VAGDGGLGAGGAIAVKDPGAAQQQLGRLVKLLAKELSGAFDELRKQSGPARLSGLRLGVRARPLRVSGLKVDLFELAITWPRAKTDQLWPGIEQVKTTVTKLLGPRPTLAFAATGQVGLVAFGKDYKKRLGELLAIAKGGPGSVQERRVRELAAGRPLSTLVHVPLASLLEGAMRAADQLTSVPPQLRDGVNKILPGPAKDIPVTALVRKDGETLYWELEVSSELVATLARAVFWFRGMAAAP
jgi:hypothetical protein